MNSPGNSESFCQCSEAFEWPRGVGFDGNYYRCPSCRGFIEAKYVSQHRIIPRSEFLGIDPLEAVSSVNIPYQKGSASKPNTFRTQSPIYLIVAFIIVILILSQFQSNDSLAPTNSTPTNSNLQQNQAPSYNYYEEPCEDTFTREEYQDCLEDLWMEDYRNDMKYNYGEP